MDISLITVRYEDDARSLERLAASFRYSARSAGLTAECIVVDNTPSPLAQPLHGYEKYIHSDQNLYHSGGSNLAADHAGGRLLLFANPDLILGANAVLRLVRGIESNGARWGVAEGRQIPFDHPKPFDEATGRTPWASGAFMLIERSVFDRCGRFDASSLPMYCNDVDLSWRVRASGLDIRYVSSAYAWHGKRLTREGSVEQSPHEHRSSVSALLCLAHKWRRDDVVDRVISMLRGESGRPRFMQVDDFHRRVAEGLVTRVDPSTAQVATFEGVIPGGTRLM